MNLNKSVFSLAVPCFVFNLIQERAIENQLSLNFNTKSTSKISRLKMYFIEKVD